MISQEKLIEMLDYDKITGILTWKISRSGIAIGQIAGYRAKNGYWYIKINGKMYSRARLVWFYMTGEWPKAQIDHINGIRSDDRLNNLREATHSQNQMNKVHNTRKLPKWVYRNNKGFIARVSDGTKIVNLGTYQTIGEAYDVAMNYAKLRHGDFLKGNVF